MKITSTATIGKAGQGYRWTSTIEANEAQVKALAEFGVIYLQQRNTEIDKVLGILEETTGEDGKAKWVRTGMKRGEVNYKAEVAAKLAAKLSTAKLDDATSIKFQTEVKEYEGEVAGPAYKAKVKTIESLRGSVLTDAQVETAIDAILAEAGVSREEAGI